MSDSRPLRWIAVGLLFAVAATAGFASRRIETAKIDEGALSPKLHPHVYFEEGLPLFLAADVRAAGLSDEESIFPLGIGMANLGRTSIDFGKEEFILEDAQGNRYPVVGIQEFTDEYRRSRSDARLAELFEGVLRARFENFTETEWRPFPVSGARQSTASRVELGRNDWTMAYLYFPVPEEGTHGREFTLIVGPSDGDEERYLLRFALP